MAAGGSLSRAAGLAARSRPCGLLGEPRRWRKQRCTSDTVRPASSTSPTAARASVSLFLRAPLIQRNHDDIRCVVQGPWYRIAIVVVYGSPRAVRRIGARTAIHKLSYRCHAFPRPRELPSLRRCWRTAPNLIRTGGSAHISRNAGCSARKRRRSGMATRGRGDGGGVFHAFSCDSLCSRNGRVSWVV